MGFEGCVDTVVIRLLFLVGDSGESPPSLKFLLRCDGGNVVKGPAVAETSWVHWRIASLDGPGLFCPFSRYWKDLDGFDFCSSWRSVRICYQDGLVSRDTVTRVCTCLRNLFLACLTILVVCELGLGTVLTLDVLTLEVFLSHALLTEGRNTWGTGDVVGGFRVSVRRTDSAVLLAVGVNESQRPATFALFEVDTLNPVFGNHLRCEHPDVGFDEFVGEGAVWVLEGDDYVGVGKVGNLGVCVRVAGPCGFSGKFDAPEGFVSAEFDLDLFARPHSGLNLVVVVCDSRDVTDDDFGPGDVFLECNLVFLLFQSLDDGYARLFKSSVFGVCGELEGEVVTLCPFGGEAAEAVKVFVGLGEGVDLLHREESVLPVHGIVVSGGFVSEPDDPVVGRGGFDRAADGGYDLGGRGRELGGGFGSRGTIRHLLVRADRGPGNLSLRSRVLDLHARAA